MDPFAAKIDELVDRSRGRIGADHAHRKLVAMGYQGSERTTRRAVSGAKRRWRQKHGRRMSHPPRDTLLDHYASVRRVDESGWESPPGSRASRL